MEFDMGKGLLRSKKHLPSSACLIKECPVFLSQKRRKIPLFCHDTLLQRTDKPVLALQL